MCVADLKIDGVRLVTVSVGRDLNLLELRGISSFPNEVNLLHLLSYDSFNDTFLDRVIQTTCNGNSLSILMLSNVVYPEYFVFLQMSRSAVRIPAGTVGGVMTCTSHFTAIVQTASAAFSAREVRLNLVLSACAELV